MGMKRLVLTGFEDALAGVIAAATEPPAQFRFADPSLKDLVLEAGRHLFVNDLPEVTQLLQTYADFDVEAEPSVALYSQAPPGPDPSPSSGSRLEWLLRIVLRFGTVPEMAKQLLEELSRFVVESLKGARVGGFILKGATFNQRPTVFAREGDDHAFASTLVRFRAVARPLSVI